MSAKGDLEAAKETVEMTYDDLDRDTENVAKNAAMLLDACIRELDLQEQRQAADPKDSDE